MKTEGGLGGRRHAGSRLWKAVNGRAGPINIRVQNTAKFGQAASAIASAIVCGVSNIGQPPSAILVILVILVILH